MSADAMPLPPGVPDDDISDAPIDFNRTPVMESFDQQPDDVDMIRPGRAFDPRPFIDRLKARNDNDTGEYLNVMYRKVWLRSEHPNAVIETEMVSRERVNNAVEVVFRARITLPTTGASGTGWGESRNARDPLERAETKALGRALSAVGYDTANALLLPIDPELADSPVDSGDAQRLRASAGNVTPIRDSATQTKVDELRASGSFVQAGDVGKNQTSIPMIAKDISPERAKELREVVGLGQAIEKQQETWVSLIAMANDRSGADIDKLRSAWSALVKVACDSCAMIGVKNGYWRYQALLAHAPNDEILQLMWSRYVKPQKADKFPEVVGAYERRHREYADVQNAMQSAAVGS